MKIKLLFLFLILFSFTAFGQILRESEVPSAALTHFKKKFKMAKDVQWSKQDTKFIVAFIYRDVNTYSVYSKTGNWIKMQKEVSKKNISNAIITNIKLYYEGQDIISILNTTTANKKRYYEIKLMQRKGYKELITVVHTSTVGYIIKEILPPELETFVENRVNKKDLPEKVLSYFNTKFLKATDVKWKKQDTNYVASFFLRGFKTLAVYSDTGRWCKTIKNLHPLTLRESILNYLETNHKKEELTVSQYITKPREKYFYLETVYKTKIDEFTNNIKTTKIELSTAGKLNDISITEEKEIDQEALARVEAARRLKEEKEAARLQKEKEAYWKTLEKSTLKHRTDSLKLIEEKKYEEFFKAKLKKFNVKSPYELSESKKRQFFSEIDKEWTGNIYTKQAYNRQLEEEQASALEEEIEQAKFEAEWEAQEKAYQKEKTEFDAEWDAVKQKETEKLKHY